MCLLLLLMIPGTNGAPGQAKGEEVPVLVPLLIVAQSATRRPPNGPHQLPLKR
jgi:hypothetical protein